jgi:chemotaxis protein CheC
MEQSARCENLDLSDLQMDALKEICNIGMGHAATALNQMIGKAIHLNVPEANIVPLDDIPAMIAGPEEIVAGIYLKIWGDFQGNLLFIFPHQATKALCNLLTGLQPNDDLVLSEMHASALREIGNILASSFLTAIERLLGKTLIPSIPGVAFDLAGAIVDSILMQLGEEVDVSLVVKATFNDEDFGVHGHLYLLPDQTSLCAILAAAKALYDPDHRR